jgi:AcrR family transcriptional regulator
MCAAAERLFAEKGPDAVTIRQLAAELGVSPMTPYRYFKDKDDILAATRASGFNRFALALETARRAAPDVASAGAAVGAAYVAFALENPDAYKLMFDMDQPNAADYPELVQAGQRARATMTAHVDDAIAAGLIAGEPEEIGVMMWASLHGAVVLELAGMLPAGGARRLQPQFSAVFRMALGPVRTV